MSLDGARRRVRELHSEDFQGMKKTKYDQEKEIKSEQLQKAQSLFGIESLLFNNAQNNNSVNFLWKISFQKDQFVKNFTVNDCHSESPKEELLWEFRLANKSSNNITSFASFTFKITCKKLKNLFNVKEEQNSIVLLNPIFGLVKYEDDEPEDVSLNEEMENRKKIEEYFENKEYSADIELIYCNLQKKSFHFKMKNIKSGNTSEKEILIPFEIYSKLIKNQTIVLIFDITLSRNFAKFKNNTKKKINYTGLINEGMTCYMNSMLQTLNVLGSFKKAVFQIPVKEEDNNSKNNIVLCLQRLFYDLMFDTDPVSTNRLIKSFGWGRDEMLIQHDVQEFNQLLSDMMDKKMKGTSVEGTFAELFEGKLLNYIDCVNVDYQSRKKEKFCDLSLTIKGCKNIYESLNKYTEIEILENDNKYETETFGKQNARKGIKFLRFPSVMILQLKRFEYNPRKETMMKINDNFEFPETLDLNPYMSESSKFFQKDNLYTLHSIVVHKGSANSGHYFSFIRPGIEDFWLKFNDDIVRPANKFEVYNNNYGGILRQYKHKGKGDVVENNILSEANAYILVYIRNSMRENILKPVTENDIPLNLKEKFDIEKKEEKLKLKSNLRLENNANLILFSKQMIIGRNNIGIQQCYFDTEEKLPLFMNYLTKFVLNFPKSFKMRSLLEFIEDQTKIPKDLISLYIYESSYQNIITRYNYSLQPIDLELSIQDYCMKKLANIPLILFVYIENPNFQLFEMNEISNQSFNINEKSEIFVNRRINSWSFSDNSISKSIKMENTVKNNLIIFIKYLKYDSTCKDLILDDVLSVPKDANIEYLNKIINFNQKCKFYLSGLDKIDEKSYSINFLVEKNVLLTDLNKISFTDIIDPLVSLKSINEEQESLIIIVNINFSGKKPFNNNDFQSTRDLIEKICLNYLSNVYINVFNYCRYSIENESKKYLFNIFETDEKIKQNLLNIIKNNIEYKDVFSSNFYLNINQQLIKKEILEREVNTDYIEIISDKESTLLREYPMIKYLNNHDTAIFFQMNIFPKTEINFSPLDLLLFDEDNNQIERVCISLPKRLKTCKEIIDFIYEPLLLKFYKTIIKEELYFVLQNPSLKVIYEVMKYNNEELFQYHGKEFVIDYRIQPYKRVYSYDFLDYNGHYKIFFSFISTEGVSIDSPFFIFLNKEISIKNFYEVVLEKIKFIKKFEVIEKNQIKIYKSKYCDFVEKNYYLSNPLSEESIITFFKEKNKFFNVLIEIPIYLIMNQKL